MLAKYARKENATDKILRNHLEVKWCLLKCISGCKFLEKLLVVKNSCKVQWTPLYLISLVKEKFKQYPTDNNNWLFL
jgi:hypothetical protein